MKPAPDTYFDCPKCGFTLSNGNLASGNTIGARVYSDSKMIAPMLPDFPLISKCPECGTIFWLSPEIERYFNDFSPFDEVSAKVAKAKWLNIEELHEALENQLYKDEDQENCLRMSLLWSFNDRIRYGEQRIVPYLDEHEEAIWYDNIRALIKMIPLDGAEDSLFLAELHRYLGDFEKGMEILEGVVEEKYAIPKNAILRCCKNKSREVVCLN